MNTPHSHLGFRRGTAFLASLTIALLLAPAGRAADDEKFHDELRQLKTLYETALSSGDLTPLAPLFTPESSGVVVDNQTFKTFEDLKSIHERFRASFPGVIYRIKVNPELSKLYGDVAVAHGTCGEYVKTSAGEFTYTSNWTAVLRRVDGQWKLVRSQVTMDPFRNSVVQHFLSRTKLYFGGGALALGLIVGLLAGRSMAKKAS